MKATFGLFAVLGGVLGLVPYGMWAQANVAAGRGPVLYVMPNAFSGPATGDPSQVVVSSAHNGQDPQIAKIYQELQHRKECQAVTANMIKEKADYFLLLQHGGGRGNRWVICDKSGNVVASGESIALGNSVKDACVAVEKNWRQRGSTGQ